MLFKMGVNRRRRRFWYARLTDSGAQRRLRELLAFLAVLIVLHTLAMVLLEDLATGEALWLTLTTITTVGYGDVSAATPAGRFATVVLMYALGITVLAQFAGEYIDFRIDRRDRRRRGAWSWDMENHLVIVNAPARSPERYLTRLVGQLRGSSGLHDMDVQLLTTAFPDGLPEALRTAGVVHYHGNATHPGDLEAADAALARCVFVLAEDSEDPTCDSTTLDILERLQRIGGDARVVAECVQDDNRERFKAFGADNVIRPVRAYPELLVRTLAAPGTELLLENLFTHEGDHPHRFDVAVSGRRWGDLVTLIMEAGIGTPLAYVTADGHVVTNPKAERFVEASALIVMVDHEPDGEAAQLESLLANGTG